VLALVVAGGVAGVELTKSSSSGTLGAQAFVIQALARTIAKNSLSFTLDEAVSSAGTSVNITGSGKCDLTTVLCSMTMNPGGALSSLGPITAIIAHGTMYEKLGPAYDSKLPTPWISMPMGKALSTSSSTSGSVGNPLAALSLAASEGAVVTDNGTVNVNGASGHEYTVTFSQAAAQSLVTSKLKSFPAWMRQAAANVTPGSVTEVIDVNPAGLLAKFQVTTSESVSGQSASVSLTENVTGYGVVVNVSAPPANQVTPESQIASLMG
jgi:hypothetical protein